MKHKAEESLDKLKESMNAFHERTNSEVGKSEIDSFNKLQDLINCQLTQKELALVTALVLNILYETSKANRNDLIVVFEGIKDRLLKQYEMWVSEDE